MAFIVMVHIVMAHIAMAYTGIAYVLVDDVLAVWTIGVDSAAAVATTIVCVLRHLSTCVHERACARAHARACVRLCVRVRDRPWCCTIVTGSGQGSGLRHERCCARRFGSAFVCHCDQS